MDDDRTTMQEWPNNLLIKRPLQIEQFFIFITFRLIYEKLLKIYFLACI